jgi:hypothetical protein
LLPTSLLKPEGVFRHKLWPVGTKMDELHVAVLFRKGLSHRYRIS